MFLLKRGEAQPLGEMVEPDTPSVLKGDALKPYSIEPPYEGTSGRRLALARWLTQPNHPLTARVMMNRLWRHTLVGDCGHGVELRQDRRPPRIPSCSIGWPYSSSSRDGV